MYRIGKEEMDRIQKVFDTKQFFRPFSVLKECESFEKEWAEKMDQRYSILVNGGTQALIAGLVGLEIGPGDEVIIPAFTFMATASAVLAVGAIPVIAEVNDTLTISPEDMESKISRHTRAVIPVHITGFPCDMDKIYAIASKNNLKILEDACQAIGGSYKGKRLGAIGNAGAYSFNACKILTCGEGGCIVTNDATVFERGLAYHDGGCAFRTFAKDMSIPIFSGVNNRVSEISGAIMRQQLKRLDGILSDLRRVKKEIMDRLSQNPKIRFVRSNDIEGDCGSNLCFVFDSEKKARTFIENGGIEGYLPIDSGKHVYCNWDPVIEKRGSHHPALNPYNLPQNQGLNMNYSKDMCPVTLDILSRTVLSGINPDWTNKEIDMFTKTCIKAVERI